MSALGKVLCPASSMHDSRKNRLASNEVHEHVHQRGLAGKPPLVVVCAPVAGAALAAPVVPTPCPGVTSDEPLPVLPEDGAPEVSGTGGIPAEPELPPLRMSGATGVLTSTPLLAVPASERPLEEVPEPTAAGELPGLDSLRRSQPASADTSTHPNKHGSRAGEKGNANRRMAGLLVASGGIRNAAGCAHR